MTAVPQPFSRTPVSDWVKQFQQSESTDDRFQALLAIGSLALPTEIIQAASRGLSDTDATIRAFAAKLVRNSTAEITGDIEKQLIGLLDDPDPDVRFESARALIRRNAIQPERVLNVLTMFLDEPETDALMISSVLNAIVELDLTTTRANDQLLPRLLRLLDHDRAEVREAVAIMFARWPLISKTCTDRLLPLLDDREPVVREKIAYTIGQAGNLNDEIEAALKVACEDEDTEVARESHAALRQLRQQ